MGKTKWGHNGWQGKHGGGNANGAASSSQPHWEQWGAHAWDSWSNKPQKGQGSGMANKDGITFPKYQDMSMPTSATGDTQEDKGHKEEDGMAEVPTIQRLVNNIRKAEARIRKNKELKAKRDQQWALYQEEVKKLFISQRVEYRNDVHKLEKEETEAVKAREQAVSLLKECINGKQMPVRAMETESVSQEDLQSWDELLNAMTPSSRDGKNQMDTWLQEMITATTLGGTAALSMDQKAKLNQWVDGGEPMTPPSRRTAVAPRTPTTQPPARLPRITRQAGSEAAGTANAGYCSEPSTPVDFDPYLASPGSVGQAVLARPSPPRMDSEGMPSFAGAGHQPKTSPVKPKTGLVVPRVPVKQMAKFPPVRQCGRVKTLSDLVESKRIAAQKELGLEPGATTNFILDDGDEDGVPNVDLTAME